MAFQENENKSRINLHLHRKIKYLNFKIVFTFPTKFIELVYYTEYMKLKTSFCF